MLWRSRWRKTWMLSAGVLVVVFTTIKTVPEKHQSRLLDSMVSIFVDTQVVDLRILPFSLSAAADEEMDWLRMKVERKLVELFTDSGLRVAHRLSTEPSDAQADRVLRGNISRRQDRLAVAVSLAENDVVVSSAQLEGPFLELEGIFQQYARAIVYGMDIDPKTLRPLASRNRPTQSVKSYGLFLEAQRAFNINETKRARSLLQIAVKDDPTFAMGYWAIGELSRHSGDLVEARTFVEKALTIDEDHPRQPLHLNVSNSMPALWIASRAATWQPVANGFRAWSVNLASHGLLIHAWELDLRYFELSVVVQLEEFGSTVAKLRSEHNAALAINGGFFEIDSEDRISPSGVLILDGQEIHPYVASAGSGVLIWRDGTLRLDWSSRQRSYAKAESAVQSGPFVVDPGGKNGIYSNDFDRRKRSAICITEDRVILVSVGGSGLSLYELGELLSRPSTDGGFGCERALNLDGGASTQASVAIADHALEIEGTWKIQNAVIVKRR